MVTSAQKKRSKAKKDARATGGGGPSHARLDQENELILSAAEANGDLPSTTDCEPPNQEPNRDDIEVENIFQDEESQSLLNAAQNTVDNEVALVDQSAEVAAEEEVMDPLSGTSYRIFPTCIQS